jgi:hypothetical protein
MLPTIPDSPSEHSSLKQSTKSHLDSLHLSSAQQVAIIVDPPPENSSLHSDPLPTKQEPSLLVNSDDGTATTSSFPEGQVGNATYPASINPIVSIVVENRESLGTPLGNVVDGNSYFQLIELDNKRNVMLYQDGAVESPKDLVLSPEPMDARLGARQNGLASQKASE